jgi:2-haloacid dehalogenase
MDDGSVKALLFDVFGTVVDWRSSITREGEALGKVLGIERDWADFADRWRAGYQPAMEECRAGRRPYAILDILHREILERVLDDMAIEGLDDAAKDDLTHAWHRLDPWPDAVAGLARLKTGYIIGTLSNGNVALMVNMAKRAGLPWDVILGAEVVGHYKPDPKAYLESVARLGLEPGQVMLVAAHNADLRAARDCGLRTAFIRRPTEYGPDQDFDFEPEEDWDHDAQSFLDLADQLGV